MYNAVLDQCDECAAGTFKNTVSNTDLCSSCPDNTYSEETGLTTEDDCIQCPSNSTQLASTAHNSIESCRCDPGTKRVRSAVTLVCVPCEVGKFTLSYNALSCDACLADQYYDASTNTCQSCPDFSTSPAESYSIQNCTCNAGYFTTTSSGQLVCEPCGEGHFVQREPSDCNARKTLTLQQASPQPPPGTLVCAIQATFRTPILPSTTFCVPCPEDTFCPNAEIIACPIHSNTRTALVVCARAVRDEILKRSSLKLCLSACAVGTTSTYVVFRLIIQIVWR